MKTTIGSLIALLLLSLASCSHAGDGDIDKALSKAKSESKIVMLELGSVGCMQCENMKPVMQKLRETYPGKLEVIFVDVKKDHDTAGRFRVFMIPVQVFLDKNGKEFHRHMGFYAYEEIEPVLKKAGL